MIYVFAGTRELAKEAAANQGHWPFAPNVMLITPDTLRTFRGRIVYDNDTVIWGRFPEGGGFVCGEALKVAREDGIHDMNNKKCDCPAGCAAYNPNDSYLWEDCDCGDPTLSEQLQSLVREHGVVDVKNALDANADGDFLAYCGTDAQRWAEQFAGVYDGDVEILTGWFANAIEAGRAAGIVSND